MTVQKTLKNPVFFQGTGLHSGRACRTILRPAGRDYGIRFKNLDFPELPPVELKLENISTDAQLATRIGRIGAPTQSLISTIEHLCAALFAEKITNLLIECRGGEIPILDGCARDFVFLLRRAGYTTQRVPRKMLRICQSVRVENEHGGFATLSPSRADNLEIDLSIEFPATIIGRLNYRFDPAHHDFYRDVAWARTFVEKKHIPYLHENNLALGGNLKNALVIDGDIVVNPEGFKTPDECARHKVLDVMGDLFCLGIPIAGKFTGHKTGHALNRALLEAVSKTHQTPINA